MSLTGWRGAEAQLHNAVTGMAGAEALLHNAVTGAERHRTDRLAAPSTVRGHERTQLLRELCHAHANPR